ncbi:MAG TPA: MurR/RpiR family transcriptional regulator [Polyangiaceae bacterium]|nr:MurR/RpiR family transcriptional regulator [Polyangiaceae bacterium]
MGKTAALHPESFDDLEKAIIDRFPTLSKRLQQIASHALDNPSELALETIAAVAQRAGVQPSSLIRFAKVFGFSGYSDMQRVFRFRLTDAMPDYKERLRSLRGGGETVGEQAKDVTALLEQFVEADIVGLQCLLQQKRTGELLEHAFKLIAESETVYLVAHRRSFPVSCYLAYAMSQMNVRNVLVDGVGGMFFQQVSHAGPRDVIFAISSKAYSPDVVQVVREAAQRGVKIIAMTDSPLSPLAEHAEVSLEVQQASVGLFRSLAVTMTLAITLIVGLGRHFETTRQKVASKRHDHKKHQAER